MAKLSKTRILTRGMAAGASGAAVLLLAVFCLATCEMGLGPQVDLEAPELHVTHIVKPDGTIQPLEEGSKLFVGPGLLVGNGFKLEGTAQDNIRVERVEVEAVGVVVDGQPLTWSVNLPATDRIGIVQNWSIQLDLSRLEPGEKMFRITAYDRMSNIGEETVKEYTLLIDKYPPIINNIRVERWPGLQVALAPKDKLKEFDVELFDHIDYFQNGNFTIRAVVDHKFDLSDVWLNFIHYKEKEDGTWGEGVAVFTAGEEVLVGDKYIRTGIEMSSGSLNAPSWEITEEQLVNAANANPYLSVDFAAGRHYMSVVITAKARAGHSGYFGDIPVEIQEGELIPNVQFSLCWYPEADIPRIKTGELQTETGGIVLVNVFDDDNLGEVYAAMVTRQHWEDFMPGSTDAAKLAWLIEGNNHSNFVGDKADDLNPLRANKLTGAIRSTGIGVEAGYTRGEYRMVVLARDVKRANQAGGQKWETGLYTVMVTEEGIPIITISDPEKGSSAELTAESEFTIRGNVQDISEVQSLRMAWVPAAFGEDEDREDAGKAAFARNIDGSFVNPVDNEPIVLSNGIKIWPLELGEIVPPQAGGKYSSQDFSITFNVLSDFMYNGEIENESKVFVFYAVGKGGDSDESFMLEDYKLKPIIELEAPMNFQQIPPARENISNIEFQFTAFSRFNVPLKTVKLWRIENADNEAENVPIGNLSKSSTFVDTDDNNYRKEIWTAADMQVEKADYSYRITIADIFGNESTQRVTVQVTEVPNLTRIQTTHADGTWFPAGERVTVQAVFNGTVSTVNHFGWTRIPRIRLGGITNKGTAVERYAEYIGGQGSSTLSFVYTVQTDDYSEGGIQALQILGMNGTGEAIVAVDRTDINGTGVVNDLASPSPSTKVHVDGIAPYVTGVLFEVSGADEYYSEAKGWWIREGVTIRAKVAMSKKVAVWGVPNLILGDLNNDLGNPTMVTAVFRELEADEKTLLFEYRVRNNIQSGNRTIATNSVTQVTVYHNTCFSSGDMDTIRDQIGSMGNILVAGTGSSKSNIRVDAVRPSALNVVSTFKGSNPRERFRIDVVTGGAFETQGGTVEYTEDNGGNWLTANAARTFEINERKGYSLRARQIDRAGNESPRGNTESRDLTTNCDLIAIICDSADGVHRQGNMVFKMVFSGPVIFDGTNRPSITVGGGTAAAPNNTAITPSLSTTTIPSTGTDTIEFSWNILANRDMNPVQVTGIGLTGDATTGITVTGVKSATNPDHPVQNNITATGGDFLKRPNLRVLSIRPTIESWGTNSANTGTVDNPLTTQFVLGPSNQTPTQTQLRLNFSRQVWPEKGKIVLRPADGWHIPPVLSNDDYSAVLSAISGSSDLSDTLKTQYQNTLNSYYTRTTHGLQKNASGAYISGTPDISTKYVLRFDVGVSGTAAPVSDLRTIFDAAKYLWQEIEVVNPTLVTNASGTSIIESGSTIVRVNFNRLADGRLWRVGIEGGSFRDEAGNTFAGWQWALAETNGNGAGSWAWDAANNRFWTQYVAEPVIRVERVSNNLVNTNPTNNRNNTANPFDANTPTRVVDPKGTTGEEVSRINVRYRIDCETPGATIYRNIREQGTSTVANAPTPDSRTVYGANSNTNSPANSNIANATAANLAAITLTGNTSANSTTGTNLTPIGGATANDLYVARKDYIAARATRTGLSDSARGYEGAFKTVIVYRDTRTGENQTGTNGMNNSYSGGTTYIGVALPNNRYVKIEAVDQRNGPIAIAGFPMNYNDMSG
ncbi:MAG: hypothetical protein LBI06_01950, partial [Treponema sp.]|nr:hypothetical protein [Treponema sp.]